MDLRGVRIEDAAIDGLVINGVDIAGVVRRVLEDASDPEDLSEA